MLQTKTLPAARCRARICVTLLAALLLLARATPSWPLPASSVEYQVKAAFLLNFAKFIEWPPGAFHSDTAPITLCVFTYDPFGSALDDILRGKNIHGREVLSRRTNELLDLKHCQVVFVSDKTDTRLSEVLNALKGSSVLLVGEGDDFAERGGAVQFFLEDKKLRFAVNVDAVQRAGLTVSSKMLALARIVQDHGHPKGH
ncbi:MAG: YfiR family protein [Acidobacteriota bacterium]|nr:YfiR family protein [Acidobacteriota bacterium]